MVLGRVRATAQLRSCPFASLVRRGGASETRRSERPRARSVAVAKFGEGAPSSYAAALLGFVGTETAKFRIPLEHAGEWPSKPDRGRSMQLGARKGAITELPEFSQRGAPA